MSLEVIAAFAELVVDAIVHHAANIQSAQVWAGSTLALANHR